MLSSRTSKLTFFLLLAALAIPVAAQQVPLDALMRGGRIHFDGQRFQRAKEQFTKALDQYGATADNTALAQIHLWLGLSEAELKQPTAAADNFVKAMQKDSSLAAKIRLNEQWQYLSWQSLIAATRDNYNTENNEAALTFALAAIKVDPGKPQTYALVANIYSALERFDEMRAVANDLLNLDKRSPDAFGLLGLYFLQKPDSLWPSKEARFARWDSVRYYYDLAIAVHQERFDKAVKTLADKLKVADPAKARAIAWQLVKKSRLVDQAELKKYIEQDLNAAKQLPEVAQLAGQLFFSANNLNVASARAGTAMLRAAAEARADTAERFRVKAEQLFALAVEYDSSDYTALFDLGIALYQGQKDTLAEQALQKVVDGAVVPIAMLPQPWLDSVLAYAKQENLPSGSIQLTGLLAGRLDSIFAAQNRLGVGYNWLYFPNLKEKKLAGPVTTADTAGMFMSLEPPQLVEQLFLWLGSSQTGSASALSDAKRKDDAKAKYLQAIVNLLIATRLDPNNSDAFQNLGICYRETDQKDLAFKAFTTADKLRKSGR